MFKFDWNEQNAASNLVKHKVSFEEAASVFHDAHAATYPDGEHSLGEPRFLTFYLSALLSKTAKIQRMTSWSDAGSGQVITDFQDRASLCCPRSCKNQRGLWRILRIGRRGEWLVKPSHQIAVREQIHAQQRHQVGQAPAELG